MEAQTIGELQAAYNKLEEQEAALVETKQAIGAEMNRLRGAATIAERLRGAGISEAAIPDMVAMEMRAQTEAAATAEAEARRAVLAEAEAQEDENYTGRRAHAVESARRRAAGQPVLWYGDPSVDGHDPAPPRSTEGSAELGTQARRAEPGGIR